MCSSDLLGDLPLIHQTRLLQNLLRIELLVEEAVTAHQVPQMKVHPPPRGQNGFLVGVAEVAEDLGNALHTLGGQQLVRRYAFVLVSALDGKLGNDFCAVFAELL